MSFIAISHGESWGILYVNESNLNYRIEIIDDMELMDVISTESQIENMINWAYPIDYIKVIISNKEDNISEELWNT